VARIATRHSASSRRRRARRAQIAVTGTDTTASIITPYESTVSTLPLR
jgi:hypothetical protein